MKNLQYLEPLEGKMKHIGRGDKYARRFADHGSRQRDENIHLNAELRKVRETDWLATAQAWLRRHSSWHDWQLLALLVLLGLMLLWATLHQADKLAAVGQELVRWQDG